MTRRRLAGRDEPIIDPCLPIVDAHHHLFDLPDNRYLSDDLLADVTAGHNVKATIYCETQSFRRQNGPEWLRPLGEIEFANGVGAMHASGVYGAPRLCAGIIGYADLRFGAQIGKLLDRCLATAPERFRGIRQATIEYPDDRPFRYLVSHRPPAGILEHAGFAAGLREVQSRGLVFDAAIFDPTLPKIMALADRYPDLIIVLNHMGTAVGVDMDPNEQADVFQRWRTDLRSLATRPNVRCKIGGLGMPMWGFRFEEEEQAPGFVALADRWRPFVETAIEVFGTNRCMMESNFPPDGRSCGYVPLWNALKHLTASCSTAERRRMFHDNAVETYRLNLEA